MKSDDEYQREKRFFVQMAAIAIPPYYTYEEALSRFEQMGPSHAKKSLRIGISDLLAKTADYGQEAVASIDSAFAQHGIPTLSQMRAKYWSSYKRILKRGKIRNDEEFHMLKAVFEDTEAGTANERAAIGRMISDYERA